MNVHLSQKQSLLGSSPLDPANEGSCKSLLGGLFRENHPVKLASFTRLKAFFYPVNLPGWDDDREPWS